jgi:hypothetical protein
MPDLSGFPGLDVVIGLAFLFFLLATACSAINEMLASVLGWRAKTLEDAIRNMLGDEKVKRSLAGWVRGLFGRLPAATLSAEKATRAGEKSDDLTARIFTNWRVRALVRDPDSPRRRRRRPSYMPPRALSLAVAEHLASIPPKDGDAIGHEPAQTPWELADNALLAKVITGVQQLPDGQAAKLLQKAAQNAHGTLDGFRTQVEVAFDDSMERASGWYKRKVQSVLLILAATLVIGGNVDTVHVATRLWKDPALRQAVAAQASATSQQSQAGGGQRTAKLAAADARDAVNDIDELNLPVGWGAADTPKSVWNALPGWIITIAALTLGAPFWFDTLSRVSRLRGSGVTKQPRALSDSHST